MKTRNRVSIYAVLALGCASLIGSACTPPAEQNSITVKGSDTMVQLGGRWAEVYMQEHPEVIVQVTGGGSGTGIAALINGSTDIAQASRMMREEEKEQAREARGADVSEIAVALDGITVYLNQANPVISMSIAQLDAVFRGEMTNWIDVGGNDAEIVLYGRENSSGTYAYFREEVLNDADFAPGYQSLPGTAAVINAVVGDPNGVGYGGIGYLEGVKAISIAPEDGGPAIGPSEENVLSNAYPLSRNLYFYTIGEPSGIMADFIDWTLGAEGQAIVSEAGYFPLQ
jgi:phosphate transport system substrate-binding protein